MLFLAGTAFAPQQGCTTAADCSLGGVCTASKCACWPTWSGPNCSVLNLQASTALCAGAFRRPNNQSSWGGSVLLDNGVYHMYSADMEKHCGLNSWQRNSRIVHLTSTTPTGPFIQRDVVEKPFAHNPTVHRANGSAGGDWLIYHIGSGRPDGNHGPPLTSCTNGTTPTTTADHTTTIELTVGSEVAPSILWSTGPNGPWSHGDEAFPHSALATAARDRGAATCNNPGPFVFPNGTVILVCKITSHDSQKIRQMAVAVADWRGPYIIRSITHVFGEDAYVFQQPQDGNFHMLLHSMHPHKVPTTAWSPNGIDWTPAFVANMSTTEGETYPSFPSVITLAVKCGDESVVKLRRRERHQVLVDAKGIPTHLFNGVEPSPSDLDFSYTAVQPLAVAASDSSTTTATTTDFNLKRISPTTYPHAKCLDGTPPAYYWRDGVNDDKDSSLIIFFQGGGWCYPSEIQQPCEPTSLHCTANCHIRANTSIGTTNGLKDVVPASAMEGGTGFLSGNISRAGAFADFAVAYVHYCDGGSYSGTMTAPDVALNGTGPLYYAGKWNLDATLDELVKTQHVERYLRIVVSGCSAGGMACAIHCDYIHDYFDKASKGTTDVRCICDAGVFMDVPTVTGAGNVMKTRFYDVADKMATKASLNPTCIAKEADWRECMFSETALKHTATPYFVINSQYNFGEWEMLAPPTSQSFPPDTTASPADWQNCYPSLGKLTPQLWETGCNATQKSLILNRVEKFMNVMSSAWGAATPQNGAWLNNCPSMHCQTGFDDTIMVSGMNVREAVSAWYFDKKIVKAVDGPFPSNPTCPSVRKEE